MASTKGNGKAEHKTKEFGNSERTIPHHIEKARKFYPVEDEAKPKKVRQLITFPPVHCAISTLPEILYEL